MAARRLIVALVLGLAATGAALIFWSPQAAARIKVLPIRDVVFAPSAKAHAWLGGPGGYFPDRAARQGVGGQVLLSCIVEGIRQLTDCQVTHEEPAGYGFGDAALLMARRGAITASPVNPYPLPRGDRERFRVDFPKPGPKPCPPGSRQRHC